jgi:UDP-N-acetylglucosamine--N-acetylmuramyl-(pentapeptide) pyrophosphoryl-undecaprenol N-acetylglucosamine transferase
MKVYFAPCGIGLGHVGRCLPIAKRLAKENVEIIFSTYREGIGYVERENFPLLKAPPIGFQVKPDGSVDFRQTVINPGPFIASFTLLNQIGFELKAIGSIRPDIVVSDSRVSPLIAARLLGVPRICILNQFQMRVPRKKRFLRLSRLAESIVLAFIGLTWTMGNSVLIPDFPPPYTICEGNLVIPRAYRKSVKLIGPILPERPNSLPTKEKLRKKLNLPMDKPVIFVPISGPTTEKAFVTGVLRKILLDFPSDYEIVVSYGYPNADTKPIRHGNVTIYRWLPNRFEYLKACDVAIGRAGHGTITQCICYGKPMVIIPTPGHTEQLTNADHAKNLGVAKIVLQEVLDKEKLLKSVQHLLQPETIQRTEEVQKEALKHDGLKNAAKAIVAVANNEQVF